jgi:hypothetical protein
LRAFRAAEFYLDKVANSEPVSLKEAARCHGTNVAYIQAAITVLRANNPCLVDRIVRGEMSLLEAAKWAKPRVEAFAAFEAASPANRAAILAHLLSGSTAAERTKAARAFGHPDRIWDDMVEPLLKAAE